MHSGEIFKYITYYELINAVFHQSYTGWQKTVWDVPNDCDSRVWMIRIDGKITAGWKNTFEDGGNRIREEYFGGTGTMPHESDRNRLVFAINGEGKDKTFTFLGVYKYLRAESNPTCNPKSFRLYEKISDEYRVL